MSIELPNIRKLFVPDPGYMMFDADLAGAEAQVVAAEANDLPLLHKFQTKVDIHVENATWKWGEAFTSLPKDSHARYAKRQSCKHAVHAIHNGGKPDGISHHPAIGWSLQEATEFRNHWLQLHPGILEYHERTMHNLRTTRSATNKFGYRIFYFDRIETLFNQALAWIPQSTIAEVTYRGALKLEREMPSVEMLLQVHDSLVFQIPFHDADKFEQIKKGLTVEVPYDPPLIIPWGLKRSEVSWGDCEEVKIAA